MDRKDCMEMTENGQTRLEKDWKLTENWIERTGNRQKMTGKVDVIS